MKNSPHSTLVGRKHRVHRNLNRPCQKDRKKEIMSIVSTVLKRTCTAFVVGFSRSCSVQRMALNRFTRPDQVFSCDRCSSRLFSSFQAPVPPHSKGEAVYQDIDVTSVQKSSRNADPDAVFVVSGASRGIGLQFVKSLLADTKGTIVACCRDPNSSEGLSTLIAGLPDGEGKRINVVAMDLEDQSSIESAANEIKSKFSRIDVLLNVAGLLGDGTTTPGPERSITKIERDWLEKTFSVNVFGPVMLSKELAPLMAQRRRGKNDDSPSRPNSVIANLSARVGSVSDNSLGGWYSYRMSKSALNQATRTMAHELKRQSIWCIALHPGTTDTDLSKPFQKNVADGRLFPVDFTVESFLKVVNSMDDENSGGLYDWAGKAIPF